MSAASSRPSTPVQTAAEVVSVSRSGPYTRLSLASREIAAAARPGHFVACAVGSPDTSLLLRRALAVAGTGAGPRGGTVDVVVAVHGRGTAWLAGRKPRDVVDVVGPLGRPFRLPAARARAVLVGGGYGTAPLLPLAERLRERGCDVETVLGASTADRLYGVLDAKGVSRRVHVTTDDGSAGTAGRVSDVLPEVLARFDADVVYACGPMAMLAAVSTVAAEAGAVCQVAVEETMACGVGVCMTCVLPVLGTDGVPRMVRSCVEGPVFDASQVLFDAVGTVPPGTLGAPGWVPPEAVPAEAVPPAAAPEPAAQDVPPAEAPAGTDSEMSAGEPAEAAAPEEAPPSPGDDAGAPDDDSAGAAAGPAGGGADAPDEEETA